MYLNLKVKPNSKFFKINFDVKTNILILSIPEKPEKGKVNLYIEKKLKKLLGYQVKLIKGQKSRD